MRVSVFVKGIKVCVYLYLKNRVRMKLEIRLKKAKK